MFKTYMGSIQKVEDMHPNKLRHSFTTNLRAAGAELENIRDALGHSRLETSLIYAHQDQDKLRSLINRHQVMEHSLFSSLKSWFLPKKQSPKVFVLEYNGNHTFGREQGLKRIEKAIKPIKKSQPIALKIINPKNSIDNLVK